MAEHGRSYSARRQAKVFIVDDHPLMRQGLSQLVDEEEDLAVCGEAEDAHEALQAVAQAEPDIAIVDLSLKGTSGIELIKSLKSIFDACEAGRYAGISGTGDHNVLLEKTLNTAKKLESIFQ